MAVILYYVSLRCRAHGRDCKPESCSADAQEHFSQNAFQLFGGIGGYAKAIHILGAFIRLNGFIEILCHEAREIWQLATDAFGQPEVRERPAGDVKR